MHTARYAYNVDAYIAGSLYPKTPAIYPLRTLGEDVSQGVLR
jgi:hypothetical protein